jgi:hypothetical protein
VSEQLLGDVRTREARKDEEDDDEDGHDCEPIPPEADPDLLPVAARLYLGRRVGVDDDVGRDGLEL